MAEIEQPAGPADASALPPAGQKVDLQALAERLFQLLKEEARLERERAGRSYPEGKSYRRG
ncbi:MAG: hypothetical protein P8129_13375 [Anaerolineae bacterium]|jgi:hypothetical protein